MPDTHSVGTLPPMTAAEATDEMWLEVSRRHADRPVPRPPSPPPPAAPMPLDALLGLDGAAFVEAAYVAVLGRAADPGGRAHLVGELARGCDKLGVLGNLQASPEGQQAALHLEGLSERLAARPAPRARVLRRLVRPVARVLSRRTAGQTRPEQALAAETSARMAALEADLGIWRRSMEAQLVEHRLAVDNAARRLATVQAAHEELGRKTLKAMAEQGRLLATLSEQGQGLARQLVGVEDGTMEAVLALADSVEAHEARLATVEDGVAAGDVSARIEQAAGGLRAELDGRVIAAEAMAERSRQEVMDQHRRIGLMLNALRERVPAAVEAEDDHALDGLYLAFEDRFRGTRADIKERQRVYLPRLREAGAGRPDRPLLDIGAGRGEFLELMREEGLAARGVDSNGAMAASCAAAGLDCAEADALAYLGALPDGVLGAVTGFHIVEHLPFKTVVRIMDEALRVLVPGGLMLFETPNPANILTASRYFYLDPTHRNPLPGEMMAMIAEARGFGAVEVVALHPMAARFPGSDRQLAGALDAIFHGPQDYALIARRPGPA